MTAGADHRNTGQSASTPQDVPLVRMRSVRAVADLARKGGSHPMISSRHARSGPMRTVSHWTQRYIYIQAARARAS